MFGCGGEGTTAPLSKVLSSWSPQTNCSDIEKVKYNEEAMD